VRRTVELRIPKLCDGAEIPVCDRTVGELSDRGGR
jgi:hypothetical protein